MTENKKSSKAKNNKKDNTYNDKKNKESLIGLILIILCIVLVVVIPRLLKEEDKSNKEEPVINKPSIDNNDDTDYSGDIDKLIEVTSDSTKNRTKPFSVLNVNDKYYILIDNAKNVINENSNIKSSCTSDWCTLESSAMNYYYGSNSIQGCTGNIKALIINNEIKFDLSEVNCT